MTEENNYPELLSDA